MRGFADHSLVLAIAWSLRRLAQGYTLALAIGLPLGLLVAQVKWVEETIGTLVTSLQALPSICWLPLAILWFGLGETAIIFVTVMGALPPITSSVRDGVRNVPPVYLRAARAMGARPAAVYFEVLLPAALPSILSGARLGWSFAWRSLMAGELVAQGIGLGCTLMMGRELADMSQVIGVMLIIIVLGILTDHALFNALETPMRRRWGLSAA